MQFSRNDARCFKSSAWFSRGHNFPYIYLPHFLDACTQVHTRKPSKTYIRNCYFHILSQCVTCIIHISSIYSLLYNPIPIYCNVCSFSQIYQTRNSGLGVLGLIIGYFNFWHTLIKQQFLVIEVSNNDSEGMQFSRNDARRLESSAWFSRGHNFPYIYLPHFLDACIQVHNRKPSKTYIRNCYFHILSQCVTCIIHISSIYSLLYNPIPIYCNVCSFSQIYQTRNSGLGVLDLIIGYFNFWHTLIKQQFLVIEVSNNDSEGMQFSRNDARRLESSAWFSRSHNFPYMYLPHFLGACIQVHIRKSIFEMTIFTSFLYINHISFLIPIYFHVFSISLIYQTRSDAQVLKVPAQTLRIGCFPIARCGKCCKLGQERDGTRF